MLWPLAVYFGGVVFLVIAMMVLSYFLGEQHSEPETGDVWESGVEPTGTARLSISAKFYLVAMFFVIFDLETAFIVAWAIGMRQLGWAGYIEILVFILVLLVALVYLWRLGALDWGSSRMRRYQRGREFGG
jgi:NADH-quinone oxidoreductase subunit A